MQNAPKKRVFAIDFQIANTRYGMIEHLPPIYGRRLDNYRSWRNNDRSGGYNRRCGSDNNGSRSYDIAHDGGCSNCRSSDSPSAVVTVMMMVVMMRHMMVARSMMETRSSMMSTGTGKCETCHSHCCDNYCQFLVHVFLLFLSLLTSWLGNVTLKT